MLFHKEFLGLHQTGPDDNGKVGFSLDPLLEVQKKYTPMQKNLLFVPDDPGDSQSGCRNLTVPRSMNVIRNKPWKEPTVVTGTLLDLLSMMVYKLDL
jgi:hypothetical protein